MKKFVRCLVVLLVFCMAGTTAPVQARLTRQEQEYYKKKKAEEEKKAGTAVRQEVHGQTSMTEAVREMVTSSGIHVEIENLNQGKTAGTAVSSVQTEVQTETAAEPETESEAETTAEPETETASEPESKSETETAAEPETESETETASEPETESETETASEPEAESETAGTWEGEAPLVAIDPGHQSSAVDFTETEPNGPGSEEMKPCYTEGTKGTGSGLAEYELNLAVALKAKEKLEKRGYRVLLTRETHEVQISEAQRSQKANEAGADIYIRIHANSDEDSERRGALTGAPSAQNPYLSDIYNSCIKLADDILNEYCETTGLKNRGLWITDKLTGSNWSEAPVTLLELGYMTNPEDDAYMADEANQEIMAEGIANGVDKYFGR